MTTPMRWTVAHLAAPPGVRRWALRNNQRTVSFGEFLTGLREEPTARQALLAEWSSTPFSAFVWELPALTRGQLNVAFQCVVKNEPRLETARASPLAFQSHFAKDRPVTTFPNLGGDAQLIAPCPVGAGDCCAHLAVYARGAPRDQAEELLKAVATTVHSLLGQVPLWLSTSGLGVPWLHFRADRAPKYYQWAPYRTFPWSEGEFEEPF